MQNLKVLLQVFRFHHWIKNLLLFMPLVTAHQFYNLDRYFFYLASLGDNSSRA